MKETIEQIKHYLSEDRDVHGAIHEAGGKIVHTEFESGGRWSNYNMTVARFGDRYFEFRDEVGATEYQDNDWPVWCVEVAPKAVTVIEYNRIADARDVELYEGD